MADGHNYNFEMGRQSHRQILKPDIQKFSVRVPSEENRLNLKLDISLKLVSVEIPPGTLSLFQEIVPNRSLKPTRITNIQC